MEVLHSGEAAGMLIGGTLTQLCASLGTPYAFDPPAGCVLFIDEVGERPYRLDRMLTQLYLSGILSRAAGLVFGELPRCDEAGRFADGSRGGRGAHAWLPRTDPLRTSLGAYGGSDAHAAIRRAGARPHRPASRAHHRRSRGHTFARDLTASCLGICMKRIHLIGVCGTAMATLAALLKSRGYDVRGSDQNVYPPMSDFLVQQGITLLQGYSADHISAELDLVVVGKCDLARQPGARGGSRSQDPVLFAYPRRSAIIFSGRSRSIVITGTHGKTTTTSLAGWLLAHGGADPSVFIGGIAENFESSYRIGGGRDFVIEGDEYDSAFFDKTAKFLKYLPDIAVVNNIEFDHADIYPDLDAIRLAFRRLVNLVPRRGLLLLGADNADAARAQDARALQGGNVRPVEWRRLAGARSRRSPAASTRFGVRRAGATVGTFELPLLGAYNVRNALAAIAVGAATGLSTDTMAAGLREFKGVRRRLQHRGTASGVAVYDDFAHHPTAIAETLAGRSIRISRPPHLGDLRAAVGDVMPARVPDRISRRPSAGPITSCCPPCSARRCRRTSGSRPRG